MDEVIKEKIRKISKLRAKLQNTDYQAIKFAEGELSASEFAPIKEQRKAWRAEINALQEELSPSPV